MPLTGEAARTYQREYKRKRRASMRQAAAAIIASVVPTNGRPSLLTRQAQEVGQAVVRDALERSNLSIQRITGKVADGLDATKPIAVTDETDERGRKVTITTPDNDAQLRACELGIRLHERAGTIPSAAQQGSGGHTIIVQELIYAPQHLVITSPESQADYQGADNLAIPGECI